ncbi:MAG: glutaconyl-CoA decarboxylase subunit alpha, partial [Proteobacteria bacterium]|nr:glutaconyl-CoA decarboxylase subunit alpha [Pseudomonadota bacterium]
MWPYFRKMDDLGKPLKDSQIKKMAENRDQIAEVMAGVAAEFERVRKAGLPAEKIHKRGQMTVWD